MDIWIAMTIKGEKNRIQETGDRSQNGIGVAMLKTEFRRQETGARMKTESLRSGFFIKRNEPEANPSPDS
jgi:hypothetical protein